MTELFKRVKSICEKENFTNFIEKDKHFAAYRENESIYFNEYRTNIFELRKTAINNINDIRTYNNSYSHLTKDLNIINHLNWSPLSGLTIDLAKQLINKKIQWKLYNFLNKEEAQGISIIKSVHENYSKPLEVVNLSGEDLSEAYFDGEFFIGNLTNVLKYNNPQSYIAYKEVN